MHIFTGPRSSAKAEHGAPEVRLRRIVLKNSKIGPGANRKLSGSLLGFRLAPEAIISMRQIGTRSGIIEPAEGTRWLTYRPGYGKGTLGFDQSVLPTVGVS